MKLRLLCFTISSMLALGSVYSQIQSAVWTTPTTGTINGVAFTITNIVVSDLVYFDLSGANYATPLSASEPCMEHQASNNWTITFASPVSNLKVYTKFWRVSNYTFTSPPTVLAGSSEMSVTGNTVTATGWANGIIEFPGNTTSLSITSDHACCSAQLTTFAAEPVATPTYCTATINTTACDTYTSPSGNHIWTSSNTYLDTVTGTTSCDTIFTINLTIINSTAATETVTACNSFDWIDGNTYTESNYTATHSLTNLEGCDSIITLDLTILGNATTDVQTACNSFDWIDGNTYTESNNTASHILSNVAGCDSVITLDLTIINSTAATETVTACDSYVFNGITYTTNNTTAQLTLVNSAGCDSIVTLDLTIINSTVATETVIACDSYVFDGITYTTNNTTAQQTLVNSVGCDSIVTLDLTINSVTSLIVTVNNDTLMIGNDAGANYQWIDCSDNSLIAGATDAMFVVTTNGDYAVVTTVGSCSDTSDCNNVIITGVENSELNIENFNMYPNPTNGIFTLNINRENVLVEIINTTGQVILTKKNVNNNQQIDLSNNAKGVYFVSVTYNEAVTIQKIIVR